MQMDGVLFTHSSIDGHLGHFHFGVIMNNAATNTCIQGFVWDIFSFLLGTYLGVDLPGHRAAICLTPLETIKLFSKAPVTYIILYFHLQCSLSFCPCLKFSIKKHLF